MVTPIRWKQDGRQPVILTGIDKKKSNFMHSVSCCYKVVNENNAYKDQNQNVSK